MRNRICINDNWIFQIQGKEEAVTLPHTWNALDGQDGGNDYYRGIGKYTKQFAKPDFDPEHQEVFIEFHGVNSTANVSINGKEVVKHEGGYATFRANVTEYLQETNELEVLVDNQVNDRVYPQKADFTFYGGIYRDVNLVIVNKYHFEMLHCGTPGISVFSKPVRSDGEVEITVYGDICERAQVKFEIFDAKGTLIATEMAPMRNHDTKGLLTIPYVRLWDGRKDPYLYLAKATLYMDNVACDEVTTKFGVRTFSVDPQKGFFLNGKSYPLHGVSRHQDFKAIGNAISEEHHRNDMELIKELGANTVRLAHYQHDQLFYDLCDEAGMIVWAEIPYISEHMPNGRANTIDQMHELIVQNYNHPSIVTWGISNEITISTKDKEDMLDNHRELNDFCHRLDPSRLTTLACYAMCNPFSRVVHKVSDIVSYNLYLGWYVPGLFLNDWFLDLFHKIYPNRALGYSEYGAEGMPNLHSTNPKRGDHTEEYQAMYHEYMIKCFQKRPWMWATHVWNMFDFAADARDQGGEPGMNHKGLVTFDRQIKKDSFYLYKCFWNSEPMVHICSKRFTERKCKNASIKVYSNAETVSLYVNDEFVGRQNGDHIFTFMVRLKNGTNTIKAVAGDLSDSTEIIRTKNPKSYKLDKKKTSSANWV